MATLDQKASHDIVSKSLRVLARLDHRGAQGADSQTGDGAGILTDLPDDFFRSLELGQKLPPSGSYGVGMVFLPRSEAEREAAEDAILEETARAGLRFVCWREVPTEPESIGAQARATQPVIRQFFVAADENELGRAERVSEQRLYLLRRRIEKRLIAFEFAIPSLSSRTIVYKGMLLPDQVSSFFPDLRSPLFRSRVALVHSRFSTNTFPSWKLAHPFRYLCHNGEINTLKGNRNGMKAREGSLRSESFKPSELHDLFPIVQEDQSDSACLDNAVEFLLMNGRTLPEALMILMPEPWLAQSGERRAFYEYHSALMEPWDGPAAVAFTDGTWAGATLDRNGLRPCRFELRSDRTVVLASEAGVLEGDEEAGVEILRRGRLEPGRMFLLDLEQGRIVEDEEIKSKAAGQRPYSQWLASGARWLAVSGEGRSLSSPERERLLQAFGYTREELKRVLGAMALGEEAISSMGADTPLAGLSREPQLLFKYFRQLFAQVTNPPIDPIREECVMSLMTYADPAPNLLAEDPSPASRLKLKHPVLIRDEYEALISGAYGPSRFVDVTFEELTGSGLERAVDRICAEAEAAVESEGAARLILTDRGFSRERAAIPILLAVSAVQQALLRRGCRSAVALVVDTAEARDTHQLATLFGFGADAVHPYLALEIAGGEKYRKAACKGLLKILSKMGISTIQSYIGSQIFEAIGLDPSLIQKHFGGTPHRLGGVGFERLARDIAIRHRSAWQEEELSPGGDIHYRIGGEKHLWNPETISKLQEATRSGDARTFAEFSRLADDASVSGATIRGLLRFREGLASVPLDEVEPASEIVKRFTSGAMSLGAISQEAHETLAIAMNRLGAKSNTGEGGEDPARFEPLPGGDSRNSAIKQVASGRFGVTSHYLVNARELQIKIAQGAKPGEGGQLPGHKVDETIARLRHSVPGVGLISPPPHHDIYSIEDLKQLIFDLRCANPEAQISVKLVAETGVGTVAAGVAKAHADKILISGDSGGTGASPLSSIKYAGSPWELGLAETHQTLLLNGLRSRVRLETDGQLKTGRDVVIAALLGAEEFGFATAPLIVEGCIMMRKCHLNTCPVGVATQDPELRKRFQGKPEHLVNYFFFVAEEARALMARLGFRRVSEMVGRADVLESDESLAPLLHRPSVPASAVGAAAGGVGDRAHDERARTLDHEWLTRLEPVIQRGGEIEIVARTRNIDRAVGTLVSSRITKQWGARGLAPGSIRLRLEGTAGQSLGAFGAPGLAISLTGQANDYVGKGLSGATVALRPRGPRSEILIGNTALYGATSGALYVAGAAGERFAVRNSGADAVVEGCGDHGCEYMTGGRGVVLGETGRNFAAGMSGGVAYVLDLSFAFAARCNLQGVRLYKVLDDLELLELIEAHRAATGSALAGELLANWPRWRESFVQVMPIEYERALARLRTREATEAAGPRVEARL